MLEFRSHLDRLESEGLLHRVAKPVDPEWEIASMTRWMYHGFDEADRFGLLFENVDGYDWPVTTAAIGASRQVYARALDVEVGDIHSRWETALENFRRPTPVSDAPVKANVATGARATLADVPSLVWTPRKDAGPYLTTVVVTKNRETGVQNLAIYRCQMVDDGTLALNIKTGRHGFRDFRSYADADEPAPVAIVVGAAPAVHLSSITNVDYEEDELELAGGLLGEPLETTEAETVDLDVPASAELVIEGTIDPTERMREGPFGEFAGYMGHAFEKPVVDVTAICRRDDPIFYSSMGQMPPSEDHVIQSISNAALYRKRLADDEGHPTVSDVSIDETYSGILGHAIVRMDPRYPEEGAEVGTELANISQLKRVTVVNEDVDVRDPLHVAWAVNARVDPKRDVTILEDVFLNPAKDPAVETEPRDQSKSSKLVVDATVESIPVDEMPDVSIPPRADMNAALESWSETDLPELDPKRRMELLLDHHPGE